MAEIHLQLPHLFLPRIARTNAVCLAFRNVEKMVAHMRYHLVPETRLQRDLSLGRVLAGRMFIVSCTLENVRANLVNQACRMMKVN